VAHVAREAFARLTRDIRMSVGTDFEPMRVVG